MTLIEAENGMARDTNNNALISTNKQKYKNYKQELELKQNEKKRIQNLESSVEEIKLLLQQLLNKE